MSKAKVAMLVSAVLLLCSTFAMYANAFSEFTYSVIKNGEVQLNQPLTVTATTNNPNVGKIRFTWLNPAAQTVKVETVSVTTVGANQVACSTYTPSTLGDWTVKAEFVDVRNYVSFLGTTTIESRTTFNIVPEVPLIGTAGIAVAMALGLVFYKKRSPN